MLNHEREMYQEEKLQPLMKQSQQREWLIQKPDAREQFWSKRGWPWTKNFMCNTSNLECHEKLLLLFLFKSEIIISQKGI